jgi:cell division protein FtsL
MKKHKLLIYILLIIAFVLGGVRLVISNSMTTSGTVLSQINDEIDSYYTENVILAEKVLDLSSFSNIIQKADKLGFQQKKTAYSITSSLPIALKQ